MKIVRPICADKDIHKDIIATTIGITDKNTHITEYIQESFLPPILIYLDSNFGLLITIALMFVWNQPANIGFLSLIY